MAVKLSDGERLIILMLADIYKHLKIKSHEFDADFIAKAAGDGHDWALQQKYGGIFPTEPRNEHDVKETHDILTMFRILQGSYGRLSEADKKRIDAAVPHQTGKDLFFQGFDCNHDAHCGIARFIVEELGQYDEQKGRAFNSHGTVLPTYRRMLDVYTPLLHEIPAGSRGFNADQLIEILKARVHPSQR